MSRKLRQTPLSKIAPANDNTALPVVFDVRHLHPALQKTIETVISQAVPDDQGQLLLFPSLREELTVPKEAAEKVRALVLDTLNERGLSVEVSPHAFRIVRMQEQANPLGEIGYG